MKTIPALLAWALSLGLAASPPSGRPPTGPLQRVAPRTFDLTFDVALAPYGVSAANGFAVRDTPIVMPLIFQSSFSAVDTESLHGHLWLDGREDTSLNARSRIDPGPKFGERYAVIPVPAFQGREMRWMVGYRAMVWSSRIDEAGAAKITWPRHWPEEVQDALKPQPYVESADPIFAETVERISEGKLRLVPPYVAAKEIVRYCVTNIQVRGHGCSFQGIRRLDGMLIQGGLDTARTGTGNSIDLACVCVAMLRAAGIPSRVVIGVETRLRKYRKRASVVEHFVAWGEFFLPGAGWIPFDPDSLRGKGLQQYDVLAPWPDFGSLPRLNERVPLAYHFGPPVVADAGSSVWGWQPSPRSPAVGESISIRMNPGPVGADSLP